MRLENVRLKVASWWCEYCDRRKIVGLGALRKYRPTLNSFNEALPLISPYHSLIREGLEVLPSSTLSPVFKARLHLWGSSASPGNWKGLECCQCWQCSHNVRLRKIVGFCVKDCYEADQLGDVFISRGTVLNFPFRWDRVLPPRSVFPPYHPLT